MSTKAKVITAIVVVIVIGVAIYFYKKNQAAPASTTPAKA